MSGADSAIAHSLLLSCLWLGAAPCSLGCGSASTSAENDAVQVERWATAFTEADVDAIVGTYAPDALFFGTGSQTLVRKPEDIRSYFDTALSRDKPRGAELLEHSVRVVTDEVGPRQGRSVRKNVAPTAPYAARAGPSFGIKRSFARHILS